MVRHKVDYVKLATLVMKVLFLKKKKSAASMVASMVRHGQGKNGINALNRGRLQRRPRDECLRVIMPTLRESLPLRAWPPLHFDPALKIIFLVGFQKTFQTFSL